MLSMRQIWTALFCLAFAATGSILPAAHTMAHAEMVLEAASVGHAFHGEDTLDDEHHDENDGAKQHQHDEQQEDHGAELHFTALSVTSIAAKLLLPDGTLNDSYRDLQYPAPLLPPDPDPDRA